MVVLFQVLPREFDIINELNSKGNVFGLYSVYVFSCASSAKLH